MKSLLTCVLLFSWILPAAAQLDTDPDVVYVEEFYDKKVTLKVAKPGWVFANKKGGSKRGALKVDTSVELIGFTEKAYKIRGKRENGEGVSGWVSPAALTSPDKDFAKKIQAVFERQIVVRELIENEELAIGMTDLEVSQVLGKPTKSKVRRTAKGQSATLEYIDYEIENHYANFRDPVTGGIYRQRTHQTKEEKSKTVVEFENNIVIAIEESEDNGNARRRIVATPILFFW
ncbi:hypothetical protein N9830_03555 [Akkermansiaceae bacterium]|nr:hypothetical protein [Akkermansiaceae bacterium]MDA8980739.1 hypothetical protein [bacterium]MDB4259481.1 hypothetical protein [Akkermansiaceae bacterium]MDB4276122.1 hypothetical protein [Akkermansiaceae bacterium]MDB4309449.1 hypothetical protein [Akkermansiaceae bacterium]